MSESNMKNQEANEGRKSSMNKSQISHNTSQQIHEFVNSSLRTDNHSQNFIGEIGINGSPLFQGLIGNAAQDIMNESSPQIYMANS